MMPFQFPFLNQNMTHTSLNHYFYQIQYKYTKFDPLTLETFNMFAI